MAGITMCPCSSCWASPRPNPPIQQLQPGQHHTFLSGLWKEKKVVGTSPNSLQRIQSIDSTTSTLIGVPIDARSITGSSNSKECSKEKC